MSQENLEFVEALFAATGSMDKQALLAALPELIPQMCAPDIEWVEDPGRADGTIYRGHEGVRQSWERWLEQWDEWGGELDPNRKVRIAYLRTKRMIFYRIADLRRMRRYTRDSVGGRREAAVAVDRHRHVVDGKNAGRERRHRNADRRRRLPGIGNDQAGRAHCSR